MCHIKQLIINALQEKERFIGYYMLCRYLNGKGYIRYGCNAGYEGKHKPKSNPKNRVFPCPVLCPNSSIYVSKVRYWCKKLEEEGELFLEKVKYIDFNNPNVKTKPHTTGDIFTIISLEKENYSWHRKKNQQFIN